MSEGRYLRNVRDQYEAYPFPKRDPASERRRLITCELDMLGKVNHYGFGGRQGFGSEFHALVAGGGTGDSAIFLAEQLRQRGGRLTYLDISQGSMGVAQERARVRGLTRIEWVHGSILDLPRLGIGPFDYVNCAGVLHHMGDPDEGLRALTSVLKPDGCMGLMVYGRYGRIDYYATQDLMRLALAGEPSLEGRVADAKAVLERLPPNNILMRGRDRAAALKFFLEDEPNLVDALLHEQDRSYSVAEIYDFLHQAGLELVEFTNYQSIGGVCRLEYDPGLYLDGLPALEKIRRLSRRDQQTVAEIINGSMGLHSFYAARRAGTVADIADPDMVPFFLTSHAAEACRSVLAAGAKGIPVNLRLGVKLRLQLDAATRALLPLVDGVRDMGALLARLAEQKLGGEGGEGRDRPGFCDAQRPQLACPPPQGRATDRHDSKDLRKLTQGFIRRAERAGRDKLIFYAYSAQMGSMAETYFEITKFTGTRWMIETWFQDRDEALAYAKRLDRDGFDIRLTVETFDPDTKTFDGRRIFFRRYYKHYRHLWHRDFDTRPRQARPKPNPKPKTILDRLVNALGG